MILKKYNLRKYLDSIFGKFFEDPLQTVEGILFVVAAKKSAAFSRYS